MEYTPNSHAYKEKQKKLQQANAETPEEKQIVPVASGSIKPKKKTGLSKVADIFISEDVSNVKEYVMQDIVVPTIKKGILGALDMILNGGSGYSSDRRRSSEAKVSYRRYYDDPRDRYHDRPRVSSDRFDYATISYPTRGDAEAVLAQMRDALAEYGVVTVSDMYDMSRLTPPHTSNKYGWFSLKNATTMRSQGEFVIDLPKAEAID